jgi:signal transduction histidine kinase
MKDEYISRSPGRRRQDQFVDLYNDIASDIHMPTLLKKVAAIVSSEMRAQKTTVYLVQLDTQELHSVNVMSNVINMIKVSIRADSLAGYCAMTRKSFVVADAYGDLKHIDPNLRFDDSWDKKIGDFKTKDVMCVPAVFRDEVQGVIQVINSLEKPFKEQDLQPLKTLASMIGYAIYNARMFEELRTMKGLEKEKAEFIRLMIHELKSPISSAKMLLNVFSYLPENDERRENLFSRIDSKIDNMLLIVEDLLYLSKIKSGTMLGEVTVIDLADEIPTLVEKYKEQATVKGLDFNINCVKDKTPVRIDTQALKLIMSNLCSNAVKYTEQGSVSVKLTSTNDNAIIEIIDTGLGIPRKDQVNLCHEFFRASNVRNSSIKGTGVGLSGVKDLIERFNGYLDFCSQENKGSTFTVNLPLYSV